MECNGGFVRIARLIEEQDPARASRAARIADQAGVAAVWLPEREGVADPRTVSRGTALERAVYVLELDPADDIELPVGVHVDVVVDGRSGWADSLRAVAGTADAASEPLCWVRAKDVATAAAAARAGVGALFPAFDNPDSAAEWVAEYEAELSSSSASAIATRVNAACAVNVELADDPATTIGTIERYRQAGIDEVILSGSTEDDQSVLAEVLAAFDDDEVRAESSKRLRERAPAVEAMLDRAAGVEAEAAADGSGEPGSFVAWFRRQEERVVGRMSDRQLETVVGNRFGVRALLMTMAKRFRPDQANGFEGDIEFTLNTRHGPEVWSINCRPDGASARKGGSPDARLRIEASLADFLRVGTGEIPAPGAVLSGKLMVRGDFAIALRMGEMFDGPAFV
jgi:putative sterol carrier protein